MFNTRPYCLYFYISENSSKDLRRKVNSSIWHQVYFEITDISEYRIKTIILFDINPLMILDPHCTLL